MSFDFLKETTPQTLQEVNRFKNILRPNDPSNPITLKRLLIEH